MSTTPTEPIDPELNEPTHDEHIRNIALQYASFLSSKETSLKEFLGRAKKIEDYIKTGELKADPTV